MALYKPDASGRHSGAVPPQMTACAPQTKIVPPPRAKTVPQENSRFGATGAQIEAQIGVCDRYFRNFCEMTPNFMIHLG